MALEDISVIIPTKNCWHLMEPGLSVLQEWIDQAGEVIVVDSSSDETAARLKQALPYPNVRIVPRPPGLYAAWNHGIQLAKRPWTYISTAGDVIDRASLQYLLKVGTEQQADVVVSSPVFYDANHAVMEGHRWPIHELLDLFPQQDLVRLSAQDLAALALSHGRPPDARSWLGSSASNLYQTVYLQRHPFPEHAGHGGDILFGLENARDIAAVFCRRPCGSFLFHEPGAPAAATGGSEPAKIFYAAYLSLLEWWLDHTFPNATPFSRDFLLKSNYSQHRQLYEALAQEHRQVLLEMEKKNRLADKCEALKQQVAELQSKMKADEQTLKKIQRRIPGWLRKTFGAG